MSKPIYRLIEVRQTMADVFNSQKRREIMSSISAKNTKPELLQQNWRVLIVWECGMRGKGKLEFEELTASVTGWLKGDQELMEIRGRIDSDVR